MLTSSQRIFFMMNQILLSYSSIIFYLIFFIISWCFFSVWFHPPLPLSFLTGKFWKHQQQKYIPGIVPRMIKIAICVRCTCVHQPKAARQVLTGSSSQNLRLTYQTCSYGLLVGIMHSHDVSVHI